MSITRITWKRTATGYTSSDGLWLIRKLDRERWAAFFCLPNGIGLSDERNAVRIDATLRDVKGYCSAISRVRQRQTKEDHAHRRD